MTLLKPLTNIATITSLFAPVALQGATLVDFDFTGNITSSNSTPYTVTDSLDANLTLTEGFITADNDTSDSVREFASDNDTYRFSLWNANQLAGDSSTSSSLDEALTHNNYVSFTVEPKSGYTLDLDGGNLDFTYGGNDSNMGTDYAIFTSATGFNSGDALFTAAPAVTSTPVAETATISGTALAGLTGPVEIRFYMFDSKFNNSSESRWREFGDLKLNGSLSVVPEPSSTVAFIGLASCLLVSMKRRGRR